MEGLEEKLSAVLSNPQMMQQLMSMAQSLGAAPPSPEPPPAPPQMPNLDLGMLQKVSGIAKQSSIDPDQQTLLHALSPYLSGDRIGRLEKAMRAAKMAKFASAFLGQGMF
mgnify:CR=1 FL=1|jgi:hypothetical protein